jgi:hypothetical protein
MRLFSSKTVLRPKTSSSCDPDRALSGRPASPHHAEVFAQAISATHPASKLGAAAPGIEPRPYIQALAKRVASDFPAWGR